VTLSDTNLTHADFEGASLTKARYQRRSREVGPRQVGPVELGAGELGVAQARADEPPRSLLDGADFSGADLWGADFTGADADYTTFRGARPPTGRPRRAWRR
jgi:uncharacterized protein YjbI with pentapeptide repeats